MSTFRVLDLFCGAGGAAMGYHQALDELGIEHTITGIDIKPMPRYPFEFTQGDALEYVGAHGGEYDFIHASPPCQAYSIGAARWDIVRADLLGAVEIGLAGIGKPFVIENVDRAPFTLATIMLCGIQFGMNVIRHRRFACSHILFSKPHYIQHPPRGQFVTCAGHGGNGSNKYSVWAEAMQIDWMSKLELAEAIPPAYTRWIGLQLFKRLA